MNDWFWWLMTGHHVEEAKREDLTEAEAKVARDTATGTHRGRCWWHRVILGHKQELTVTNLPDVGPAAWVHCSCDRWWSW